MVPLYGENSIDGFEEFSFDVDNALFEYFYLIYSAHKYRSFTDFF